MNPQPVTWRHFAALAAMMAVAVALVVPRLADPLAFDAAHFYLPMARRLLEEGFAFLGRPESLIYAPLSYAYPALLGASEKAVRYSSFVLYCAVIMLAFYTARAAHSNGAGLLAALLVAVSPTLGPYFGNVLTEPPFLFLTAAWMASLAAVTRGHAVPGAIVGGIALALAALLRPAVLYFPLLLVMYFGWRAWRGSGEGRKVDATIALMHLLAFVICILFVVRNAVVFGVPSISGGAGNALFHGVNVLVDGFDPVYYGLSYDDGSVTLGAHPLGIEGDRLLRGAALQEIAATPLPILAEMAVKKAVAFLFVTYGESGQDIVVLRLWRVALLVPALAALLWCRPSRVVMAIALLAGYMWLIHIPVLYTHRYSVGGVDIPLALLAGVGLAASAASIVRVASVVFALVLGSAFALWTLANPGPGVPHPSRSPHDVIWSKELTSGVELRDATRVGPTAFRLPPSGAIEVAVSNAPRFHPWSHYFLVMDVALKTEVRGVPCAAMQLRYRAASDRQYAAERVVRIPLVADGVRREVVVGALLPLWLQHEGVLRIEVECAAAATLEVGRITIGSPRRGATYRERFLAR